MSDEAPDLMTPAEAADLLGTTTYQVGLMRRRGQIPCVKFSRRMIRFERRVLLEFIDKSRHQAPVKEMAHHYG